MLYFSFLYEFGDGAIQDEVNKNSAPLPSNPQQSPNDGQGATSSQLNPNGQATPAGQGTTSSQPNSQGDSSQQVPHNVADAQNPDSSRKIINYTSLTGKPGDYNRVPLIERMPYFDPARCQSYEEFDQKTKAQLEDIERNMHQMELNGTHKGKLYGYSSTYEALMNHKNHLEKLREQFTSSDFGKKQFNYLYNGAPKPEEPLSNQVSDFVGNNYGKMLAGAGLLAFGANHFNKLKQQNLNRGYTNPIRNSGY